MHPSNSAPCFHIKFAVNTSWAKVPLKRNDGGDGIAAIIADLTQVQHRIV
tara:strand:+ start:11038 stop:11187 length:150 start_codon:yes stop_codon:yes gene_type:complete